MMKRGTKGITLIALVVTIVILLILSGVTLNLIFGTNGVVKKAKEAADKTNQSAIDEQEKLNNLDKEIENIINNKNDSTIPDRTGLNIGDYIEYIPDEVEDYTDLTTFNTGSDKNNNPITQESLNWQILRKYEDGSIDLVASPTKQEISFKGSLGYNNGIYFLNDICKSLYSKGTIKARSINYNDLEYWLTDEGKALRDNFITTNTNKKIGETQTYYGDSSYYPNLYAYEIGSGIGTTETIIDGINISEDKPDEWKSMPQTETHTQVGEAGLTVTQTEWISGEEDKIPMINSEIFGEGALALSISDSWYWVVSRWASCGDIYNANFGIYFGGSYLLRKIFDRFSML